MRKNSPRETSYQCPITLRDGRSSWPHFSRSHPHSHMRYSGASCPQWLGLPLSFHCGSSRKDCWLCVASSSYSSCSCFPPISSCQAGGRTQRLFLPFCCPPPS